MKMHEPALWREQTHSTEAFHWLVAQGDAVDVSRAAADKFGRSRVAITAAVYDRFVAWDGAATRRHGLMLDEAPRLNSLLEGAALVASWDGGCFVCRAVDGGTGGHPRPQRVVLTLSRYGNRSSPAWLIHE